MTIKSFSSSFLSCSRAVATKFKNAQKGSVAINTALASIPLVVFAGGTIDYGYANYKKSQLQGALDAATLAGAMELTTNPTQAQITTAQQAAQNMFNSWANLQTPPQAPASSGASSTGTRASDDDKSTSGTSGGTSATSAPPSSLASATFTYQAPNIINASGSIAVPTTILSMIGIPTLTVNAVSQSMFSSTALIPQTVSFQALYVKGDFWKRVSVYSRTKKGTSYTSAADKAATNETLVAQYTYYPNIGHANATALDHVSASFYSPTTVNGVTTNPLVPGKLTDPVILPANAGYIYLVMEVRTNTCPPGQNKGPSMTMNATNPVTGNPYDKTAWACFNNPPNTADAVTQIFETYDAQAPQNLFVNGQNLTPGVAPTAAQLFPQCPTTGNGSATLQQAWEDTPWNGVGSKPSSWLPAGYANGIESHDVTLGQDFFFTVTVSNCIKDQSSGYNGLPVRLSR